MNDMQHMLHQEQQLNQSLRGEGSGQQDLDQNFLDIELARAEALRDATSAFEKIDIDGSGTIDYYEAEKLIKSTISLGK